jgi:hypothetical protein
MFDKVTPEKFVIAVKLPQIVPVVLFTEDPDEPLKIIKAELVALIASDPELLFVIAAGEYKRMPSFPFIVPLLIIDELVAVLVN